VVYFNVLPRYSPGGTKKNQDSPSPGWNWNRSPQEYKPEALILMQLALLINLGRVQYIIIQMYKY
jgi:hypothetical protein